MNRNSWLIIWLACCASGGSSTAQAPFVDEAAQRGLRFRHFHGGTGQYYLPESLGSGVALIDYDNDGDLDVYLLQGAAFDPNRKGWLPEGASPSNRLFRNRLKESGKLAFEDVTEAAGVAGRGYGLGVAVGDFDNDGYADLYVTCVGDNILYRNEGTGRFREVTREAGVNDPRVSTGAAFFDYDRDNDLDLLVLSYVDFTVAGNRKCPDFQNRLDYCMPAVYHPLPAKLFRNEGNGRFRDVSESSGIGSAAGAGLGIAIADFNNDGWLDAYIANDGTPNHLWINQRDGTFAETALLGGVAYDESGRAEAGMGVAAADFDNDGDEDLIVANLMGETLTLYENDGKAEFQDVTIRAKLAGPSHPFTGFGVNWFDFDQDGRLDLFVANGSVRILDSLLPHPYPYGQRNQLFRNTGGGFAEVRDRALDAMVEASRGAAFGDLDLDGDIDIIISNSNGPARLLRNTAAGRSLTVHLVRRRRGLSVEGARVGLFRTGQPTLWRRSTATGSYLSANDPAIHFGLGNGGAVERLVIEWPDGRKQEVTEVPAQGRLTIRQSP